MTGERRRILIISAALVSAVALLVACVLFWMTFLDLSPSVKLRAAIPSPDGSHAVELCLVECWAGDPNYSLARLVCRDARLESGSNVVYSVRNDSIIGALWLDERHLVIRSRVDEINTQVVVLNGIRIDYEYEPSGK